MWIMFNVITRKNQHVPHVTKQMFDSTMDTFANATNGISEKLFFPPSNANYNRAWFAAYIAIVCVWLNSHFIIVVFSWRLATTTGRERTVEWQKEMEREGERKSNENEIDSIYDNQSNRRLCWITNVTRAQMLTLCATSKLLISKCKQAHI